MKTVYIITTTYYPATKLGAKRYRTMLEVIKSWKDHLHYSGDLELIVCDDGTEELKSGNKKITPAVMVEAINKVWGKKIEYSSSHRLGIGASFNRGFAAAFDATDQAIYIPDDMRLLVDFDLDPWVKFLDEYPDYGMVRLGLVHPNLMGETKFIPEIGYGMALIKEQGYVYAGRPALFHKRFMDAYGHFQEGSSAIDCENDYNRRFMHSPGPDVFLALPYRWHHDDVLELGHMTP